MEYSTQISVERQCLLCAAAHKRHCFASHLLEAGYDILTIQKLLGHANIKTTLLYLHVTDRKISMVKSPLDLIEDDNETEVPNEIETLEEDNEEQF